jgi:hypothetical protein
MLEPVGRVHRQREHGGREGGRSVVEEQSWRRRAARVGHRGVLLERGRWDGRRRRSGQLRSPERMQERRTPW